MECIICRELGNEPLIENTICDCKYKRHNSCWIDYVHSTSTVKCILCRKEIKKASPRPTAPQSIPIITIHSSPNLQALSTPILQTAPLNLEPTNPAQNRALSSPPQSSLVYRSDIFLKILTILACLGLLILFIIFIILF